MGEDWRACRRGGRMESLLEQEKGTEEWCVSFEGFGFVLRTVIWGSISFSFIPFPPPLRTSSSSPFCTLRLRAKGRRLDSPIDPLADLPIERHLPETEARLVEHLRRACRGLDDLDQSAQDGSGRVFERPDELTDGGGSEEEGERLEGDVFRVEGGSWGARSGRFE